MNLENQLWLGYILIEAAVIGLLIYRRALRLLPVFFLYCCWDLLINIASYPAQRYLSVDNYLDYYLVETAVDSILQFSVLVELAWSVLRPIRSSLPQRTLVMILGALFGLGVVIWPLSGLHQSLGPSGTFLLHLLQTVSILRILFFLALAGCSQLLSLSWRDRELQIVTGLGIYSTISLAITVYHTHQADAGLNGRLNLIVVASYICSLVYWVVCFSQREAERKEFTPQMQNLLLAMAGVARSDREALAQRSVTNSEDKPVVWPPR
ncbi:MAG: hypothetical protein P4L40_16045 [Terracidiphilus sp.]|nr:hypothetical protein [Terracidiphilus sp.]